MRSPITCGSLAQGQQLLVAAGPPHAILSLSVALSLVFALYLLYLDLWALQVAGLCIFSFVLWKLLGSLLLGAVQVLLFNYTGDGEWRWSVSGCAERQEEASALSG